MSKQYDNYLDRHIFNVNRAFKWLKENCYEDINLYLQRWENLYEADPLIYGYWAKAEKNIFTHDDSKYSYMEYPAYDAYFYPEYTMTEVKDPKKARKKAEIDFRYAWQHHIHNNPHHWEYWVAFSDACTIGKEMLNLTPLCIPVEYVLEMICDWMSFRMADDREDPNVYDLVKWYYANKNTTIMHKNTSNLSEAIMDIISGKMKTTEEEKSCLESET